MSNFTTAAIIFLILIFIFSIIIIITIIYVYGENKETGVLEGLFFLRSLAQGIPTYMFNDNGQIVSINDSTKSCQGYSWSYNSDKIESKNGGVLYVSNPPMEGVVNVGNPGSSDLSSWDFDFGTQSFCLTDDKSFCLYNDNGTVIIKKYDALSSREFGWFPLSKTTAKICS